MRRVVSALTLGILVGLVLPGSTASWAGPATGAASVTGVSSVSTNHTLNSQLNVHEAVQPFVVGGRNKPDNSTTVVEFYRGADTAYTPADLVTDVQCFDSPGTIGPNGPDDIDTLSPIITNADGDWECTTTAPLPVGNYRIQTTTTNSDGSIRIARSSVVQVFRPILTAGNVLIVPSSGAYADQPFRLVASGGSPGSLVEVFLTDQTDLDGDGTPDGVRTRQPCPELLSISPIGQWECQLTGITTSNGILPAATTYRVEVIAVDTQDPASRFPRPDQLLTVGSSDFALVSATPDPVERGDRLAVVASYDSFASNSRVTASLIDPATESVIAGQPICDRDVPVVGQFTCSILTPQSAAPGTYGLQVNQIRDGAVTFGSIEIVPRTNPVAPTLNDPGTVPYGTPITITGSGKEPSSRITVRIDGAPYTCSPAPPVASIGDWSCPISGVFAPGPHTVTAVATDSIDTTLVSPESAPAQLTVGPSALSVNPDPAAVVAGVPVVIGGSYDGGITGAVVGARLTQADGSYDNSVTCTRNVTARTYACTFPAPTDPSTQYTATVSQTAGVNADVRTVQRSVVLTPSPGAVAPLGTVPFADQPVVLTGSGATPGARIAADVLGSDVTCTEPVIVSAAGTWSCTYDGYLRPGSSAGYSVVAIDANEPANVSAAVAGSVAIGDSVFSIETVTNPVEQGGTLIVTGNTDGSAPGLAVELELFDSGEARVGSAACVRNAGATYSCTLGLAADLATGVYGVGVTQSLGGVTTSQFATTTVIAPVPPGQLTVNPAPGVVAFGSQPITITGAGKETGSTITVQIDGGPVTCATVTPVDVAGAWSCSTTVVLPAGVHQVVATATKVSNATTSTSTPVQVQVGPSALAVDQPEVVNVGSEVVVTGRWDAGLGIGAAPTAQLRGPGSYDEPGTCLANLVGTFRCTFPAPDTASSGYQATLTQVAGSNLHTETSTASVRVRPVLGGVDAPTVVRWFDQPVSFSGSTATPGSVITLLLDGAPAACADAPATVAADGSWRCTLTADRAPGSSVAYQLFATDADAPMNVSAPTSGMFLVTEVAFAITTATSPVVQGATVIVTGTHDGATEGPVTAASVVADLLDPAGVPALGLTCVVDPAGTFSCSGTTTTAMPAGSYQVRVVQEIGGSRLERTRAVAVQEFVPPTPLGLNPLGSVAFASQPIVLSGVGKDAGVDLIVEVDDKRVSCLDGPETAAAGPFSCTLDVVLAPGQHSVVVRPLDASGEGGPRSDPVAVEIGPSALAVENSPVRVLAGQNVAVTGRWDAGLVGAVVSGTLVQQERRTDVARAAATTPAYAAAGLCSTSAATFTCSFPAPADPSMRYVVGVAQTAGSNGLVLDTSRSLVVAPTAGSVALAPEIAFEQQPATLSATSGTPGALVELLLNDAPVPCAEAVTIGPDGDWSCALQSALEPGEHSVVVRAIDADETDNATTEAVGSLRIAAAVLPPVDPPDPAAPVDPVEPTEPTEPTVPEPDEPIVEVAGPLAPEVISPETEPQAAPPAALPLLPDGPLSPGTLALLSLAVAAMSVLSIGGSRGLSRASAVRAAAAAGQSVAFADRDDGAVSRHVLHRVAEGRGDRSMTWRLPGYRTLDKVSLRVPPALAPRSPFLARLAEDGSELRAMFGSLWLLTPLAGAVLGALAVIDTAGRPLPPTLWLILAVTVLATFDALSGAIAAAVFTGGVVLSGGFFDDQAPDVVHGVLVLLALGFLWTSLPLIGSAIRPFRRIGDLSARYTWDRAADLTIASLLCAWVAQKLMASMDLFAATPTGLPEEANLTALVVLVAIAARIGLEQFSSALYPARLAAVEADGDLPEPSSLIAIGGALIRTAVFSFIGYAFIGVCLEWWVGTALFLLPQVVVVLRHRFRTIPSIQRLLPKGLVEIFVLIVACTLAVRFAVDSSGEDLETIRLTFLVLTMPPALIGLLGLFADEDESRTATWVREMLGLLIFLATTYLALQGWDY